MKHKFDHDDWHAFGTPQRIHVVANNEQMKVWCIAWRIQRDHAHKRGGYVQYLSSQGYVFETDTSPEFLQFIEFQRED